jgi:hypothetical protein
VTARTGTGLHLAAACLFTLLAPATIAGNGGDLRVADVEIGLYRVSVFTDPSPVRPGELHVSVLVTRRGVEGVAEGVDVSVRAVAIESGSVHVARATRELATDPRYYVAHLALGEEGVWEIRVELEGEDGRGSTSFRVRARERGPLGHPAVTFALALLPLAILSAWILRRDPG